MTFDKPEQVVCPYCRRGNGVTVDGLLEHAHAGCEALHVLTQQVPRWPRDEFHRAELERWRRAFPGLAWDAAWGSGRVDVLPVGSEGPVVQNPHFGGASRGVQVGTQPSRPARDLSRETMRVTCGNPKCIYVTDATGIGEVLQLATQHRRANPGHNLTYARVEVLTWTSPPSSGSSASSSPSLSA